MMTSISSVDSAALVILRQIASPERSTNAEQPETDKIGDVLKRVSNVPTRAQMDAQSAITGAFLDSYEGLDPTVRAVFEFIDSGKLKSDDPTLGDTLKKVFREDPNAVRKNIEAQKEMARAEAPNALMGNFIENLIQETISSHRDRFTAETFVVGTSYGNGVSIQMFEAGSSVAGGTYDFDAWAARFGWQDQYG
jgi:hypothetical protein